MVENKGLEERLRVSTDPEPRTITDPRIIVDPNRNIRGAQLLGTGNEIDVLNPNGVLNLWAEIAKGVPKFSTQERESVKHIWADETAFEHRREKWVED
jgi:hypothetical protein